MTATLSPPFVDPESPYFRTSRTAGYMQGVDRRNNRIYGAKILETGPLNDSRPWDVDRRTLEQLVEFGSRRNKGLKARFAHPNMSDDGLGTFVGHWRRLRIVDAEASSYVVGDLHLSQSAFATPKGDLGTYLMDLADEDPEAFGVSAATELAAEMFEPLEEDPDADPEEATAEPRRPLRFANVHAADFVDSPAATRGGLFAVDWRDSKDLPAILDWILDQHFSNLTPEAVLAKAQTYLARHYGRPIAMTASTTPNPPAAKPETPPAKFEALTCPECGTEFEGEAAGDPPAYTCPNCGYVWPAEAEPETPPEQPPEGDAATRTPPQTFNQRAIAEAARPYREAFGDALGAQWFAEGLTFAQAAQRHREVQAEQIADLQEQNKQLTDQLHALLGEAGAIPTGAAQPQPGQTTGGTIRGAIRRTDQ